MDWQVIQRSWDAQQESYLPDREQRFTAMVDVVEALRGESPLVLDLAGGTGSITARVLRRLPAARSVIVDVDDALLAVAAGTFEGDERVTITHLDLAEPDWVAPLAGQEFDAVLTATALHWLSADRVAGVYAEAGSLLAPGGVLLNADHMPDPALGTAVDALADLSRARSEQIRVERGVPDWAGWWDQMRAVPELAAGIAARDRRFADRATGSHNELDVSVDWHLDALRRAGFAHAGIAWRGLNDAAVLGIRAGATTIASSDPTDHSSRSKEN